MENDIEEKNKNVMSVVFEIPEDKINDDSSPDTIESGDSLKNMNLVVALEEKFNVEFEDEEIIEMTNYQLIKYYITKKCG
jgi:acyl carrier protein